MRDGSFDLLKVLATSIIALTILFAGLGLFSQDADHTLAIRWGQWVRRQMGYTTYTGDHR